ncbi:hypothetical protein [Kitasatospora sp. NPDC008115]
MNGSDYEPLVVGGAGVDTSHSAAFGDTVADLYAEAVAAASS